MVAVVVFKAHLQAFSIGILASTPDTQNKEILRYSI